MPTPNPVPDPNRPVKGAKTTLWMYNLQDGKEYDNPLADTNWLRLAEVKDIQPGEMTADAEDDNYLDDEEADWKSTAQGQKSAGDTSVTLAWKPGDAGQKKLIGLFDSGEKTAFKIRYPNGTVDVLRGWISAIGKTIQAKEAITRTVKITGVGRPYFAEEHIAPPAPTPPKAGNAGA